MKTNKSTPLGKWQKQAATGGTCPQCSNTYPLLSVDHIVPHFMLEQLGLKDMAYDDEENLQILCRGCNGMKKGRLDMRNPKTFSLLEKYLALAKQRYGKTEN